MGLAAEKTNQNVTLPPMLTSYLEYKGRYPDCLLLFQVGDFYEVFFDDALIVAKTINLTLTSRDKNAAQPIPMCGVPVGVINGYLNRLVAAGYSVAVVSQQTPEGPEPVKGMMPRCLERIVTPGVQVLSEASGAHDARVGALTSQHGIFALAFTDVTSGAIFVREELSRDELLADVSRAGLNEIIIPALVDNVKMDRRIGWVRSLVAILGDRAVKFRSTASAIGSSAAGHEPSISSISGGSSLGTQGKRATVLLKEYVDETVGEQSLGLKKSASFERIQIYSWDEQLALDSATRRTLELVTNASDGSERNTLFSSINLTESAGGARLLRRWLLAPSKSIAEINLRQQRTVACMQDEQRRTRLKASLRTMADLERIATRIALRACTPRELAALRDSLLGAVDFGILLKLVPALAGLTAECVRGEAIGKHLKDWLTESPAPVIGEGGSVIADGKDEVLDRARALERDGHGMLSKLELRERERTGVNAIKIKSNNQIGFFFEVTKSHADKLPADFQRRQSTTSGERFITHELKNLEQELFSAAGKARTRETELYAQLLSYLQPHVTLIRDIGRAVSEIDVFCCLATLARERAWVAPEVNETNEIVIEGGQHPVLAQILAEKFIPNGLHLDERRSALIVTGPNMGGKSTYLRQVAHLTILAQMGSFVPARAMRLGIVDGVYARLGASDNLAEGDSTFMVEMREAALICAAATSRSLVVIDEIGRGTATADGRALAQSILEWLVVQTRCRALFATHFHELTDLPKLYQQMGNVSVASVERDGVVHFTHEIVDGPANRSYGIEVAGHAGLPEALLSRARELLTLQEQALNKQVSEKSSNASGTANIDRRQLSIFEAVAAPVKPVLKQGPTKALARLTGIDLNNTTPIQALSVLEELKRIANEP